MTTIKVFGLKYNDGIGLSAENSIKYIGFTSRDLRTALNENRQYLKHKPEHLSKKIQGLRVNVNQVNIVLLATTTPDKANETVKRFINKFDTINAGWNSIERAR